MQCRIIIIGLLLVLSGPNVFANAIDNLKTPTDVNLFLRKVSVKTYEEVALDEKNTPKTEFGKNTFHKVDLDGDGATDLIVDSKYLFGIKATSDGNYELRLIDRGAFMLQRYTLTAIQKQDGETYLVIRAFSTPDIPSNPDSDIELTLVWKFNGFMEVNSKPDNFTIEKVSLETSGCFGTCPIFELEIGRDRNAKYNARKYNKPDGKFSGMIDIKSYQQIVQTINYLGLNSLKTNYAVSWTDDEASTLKITFDGGQVKSVRDYGMIGTFGLENLYGQFYELRKSQAWTATK